MNCMLAALSLWCSWRHSDNCRCYNWEGWVTCWQSCGTALVWEEQAHFSSLTMGGNTLTPNWFSPSLGIFVCKLVSLLFSSIIVGFSAMYELNVADQFSPGPFDASRFNACSDHFSSIVVALHWNTWPSQLNRGDRNFCRTAEYLRLIQDWKCLAMFLVTHLGISIWLCNQNPYGDHLIVFVVT
jgi:hypothetical protein